MKKVQFVFGIFLLSVLMLLTFCTEPSVQEPVRFYLFKHDNPAITSPIDKNEEDGWLPLLDVDLSQSDFVIEEDDIVSYDWNEQRIKLNEQVNTQFARAGTTAWEFSTFSNNYFVLALGDNPIVGGGVSYQLSAVGFRIPVLYFSLHDKDEGVTEMVLAPQHYLRSLETPFFLDDLNPNLRLRLLSIGKLVE